MTNKRIEQLRKWWDDRREYGGAAVNECLDEIVALKLQVKDANKAIKLAMKGRK